MIFEKIQEILNKGLSFMTIDDQRQMTKFLSELYDLRSQYRNDINIKKQEKDLKESIRTLELKEEKTEDGKKKYTNPEVESIISKEIQELQTSINKDLFMLDQIEGKIKVCELYRIDIRDQLKIPQYQDNNGDTV